MWTLSIIRENEGIKYIQSTQRKSGVFHLFTLVWSNTMKDIQSYLDEGLHLTWLCVGESMVIHRSNHTIHSYPTIKE